VIDKGLSAAERQELAALFQAECARHGLAVDGDIHIETQAKWFPEAATALVKPLSRAWPVLQLGGGQPARVRCCDGA
jgi:hypothetical protein